MSYKAFLFHDRNQLFFEFTHDVSLSSFQFIMEKRIWGKDFLLHLPANDLRIPCLTEGLTWIHSIFTSHAGMMLKHVRCHLSNFTVASSQFKLIQRRPSGIRDAKVWGRLMWHIITNPMGLSNSFYYLHTLLSCVLLSQSRCSLNRFILKPYVACLKDHFPRCHFFPQPNYISSPSDGIMHVLIEFPRMTHIFLLKANVQQILDFDCAFLCAFANKETILSRIASTPCYCSQSNSLFCYFCVTTYDRRNDNMNITNIRTKNEILSGQSPLLQGNFQSSTLRSNSSRYRRLIVPHYRMDFSIP